MSTQVILLQRVEKLGNMGDVVAVKPGFARNYLLPQKKALRASKANIAYFETQKKQLEADNDQAKGVAEKLAKKIEGTKVSLIRQASESGQLYGSVASRDIAEGLSEETGEKIDRTQIDLNQNYKLVGLFPIDVILHPEVKAEIIVNIARSKEEAEIQAKSGKALIADGRQEQAEKPDAKEQAEKALEGVLEDDALEAEKQRQAESDEKDASEAIKAEERAAKKAEKDAAKAAADEAEAAQATEQAEEAKPAE